MFCADLLVDVGSCCAGHICTFLVGRFVVKAGAGVLVYKNRIVHREH